MLCCPAQFSLSLTTSPEALATQAPEFTHAPAWLWRNQIWPDQRCRPSWQSRSSAGCNRFWSTAAVTSTRFIACRLQVLRLAHWASTTALIVYLISRLTEFTTRRTVTACLAQAGVITFGFLGFMTPPAYSCETLRTNSCRQSPAEQGHRNFFVDIYILFSVLDALRHVLN